MAGLFGLDKAGVAVNPVGELGSHEEANVKSAEFKRHSSYISVFDLNVVDPFGKASQ